jgi:hypothetical protein
VDQRTKFSIAPGPTRSLSASDSNVHCDSRRRPTGHRNGKGSGIPYIGHLLGVCSLVIEEGGDEGRRSRHFCMTLPRTRVARRCSRPPIRVRSQGGGDRRGCSDTLEEEKPKWRPHKEAYLEHLNGQPAYVLRVSLADKLFNVRSVIRDLRAVGDEVWERFKAGRDGQLWYYRGLADRFGALLPGQMATELSEAVAELERLALAPTDS